MTRIKPKLPPPKPKLQCSVATFLQSLPPGAFDHPVVLTGGPGATVTRGLITGKTITIRNSGAGIELTGDLVLISQGDLVVDDDILFPDQDDPQKPNINLILASLEGNVVVTAVVGKGHAPPGEDMKLKREARARADAGKNGGYIVITGVNVDIQGAATGNSGGEGGEATIEAPGNPGEDVQAAGGGGGHGGDILVCARDSINVAGGVNGSDGGNGGAATSTPDRKGEGYAMGGPRGNGGDIVFESTSADCQLFIAPHALITGAWPGPNDRGGNAHVVRQSDPRPLPAALKETEGGSATAEGGSGGAGGVVRFQVSGLFVQNQGAIGRAPGSRGGDADAEGGDGTAGAPGKWGGSATAKGGIGGPPGGAGDYTDLNGVLQKGGPGRAGAGGDADAWPGNGGRGQNGKAGGDSGKGMVIGGANGEGIEAPKVPSPGRASGTVPNGGDGDSVHVHADGES